jgi:hypothetical protein
MKDEKGWLGIAISELNVLLANNNGCWRHQLHPLYFQSESERGLYRVCETSQCMITTHGTAVEELVRTPNFGEQG